MFSLYGAGSCGSGLIFVIYDMAVVITDQLATIKFEYSDGEEILVSKTGLSLRKGFWYVHIISGLTPKQPEESKPLKVRYTEVTSPVVASNDELIALILGYVANYAGSGYDDSVPLPSSSDNITIKDVIGNKTDKSFSDLNFNPSIIGHLKASYFHAHGNSFTLPENAPVTVAPAGTAYVYGTPVLVGAYADTAFDVHWVQLSGISNNGFYNIQLCNVDGTVVYGKTSAFRDNNFTQAGNVPIQISPQPKNTAIYARVGVSTGNTGHTIQVKLFCHPYGDLV